ncbi:AsnC family transcriptional regulator [Clostridia bacterium]|nr:AsnC family transcriptional regulator [Clostridia bacterium]
MEKLLELLKKDARYSNEELAVMLGTTADDVNTKIKNYEKSGVIKGYSVILNEELIDDDKVSAIIELKVSPEKDTGFDEIARKIMQYDEVENLTLLSGAYDFSLTLTGVSVKQIGLFVSQKLSTIKGIRSTATYFTLKRYKQNNICILENEQDERGFSF